jgi:acetyltransferase
LDYRREMALLAQHDGMTLGVARYSADPDRLSAEFAVAVRSDWHGRGVGYLLMARLIEVAQQSGIGELVGLVPHENQSMLVMCRELGLSIAPVPNDVTVLQVRKSLAPV